MSDENTREYVSLAGAAAFPADIHQTCGAGEKKILLATPRGYCAGVDRAVSSVEKALELYGAPVYVRKEIVHNKFVVESLAKRGAIFVSETDEVPHGERVVFSAHGVAPSVYEEAQERNLLTIDATCPLVTKVHKQAKRFAHGEYDILLIGHAGHEEVEGTQGEAPERIQVVNSKEDIENIEVRDPHKVVWISQTTLSVDETEEIVKLLRAKFPHIIDPPSGDICYATHNRQKAVKTIAPQCDVVIVVGSANSSNSVRLVEVALDAGAGRAYRVDKSEEIQEQWLDGAQSVGVTSGASVPELLVRDVVAQLKEYGFTCVESVETVTEDTRFSLPKNLRADLMDVGQSPDRPHKVRATTLSQDA
ncbi:MAG: 4-hydroxy-3-methylbut-2-enyl diphosphate reductase [Actinomycetaceae bacterium]|nr:4-hydroxy-3-methylbut-2-enyl diphosphate reductase [Actinomycetaceae bacterium]